MPELNKRIYSPIDQGGDGYSLFMFFTGMLFLKGVLVSMAGPTPNYAIQHILSTRSPREAALENMVMALVSLAPRFLLIAGIAVLGIVFFSPDLADMGSKVNFEKILPHVLHSYVPVGFKGILIAALIASFMSTFVSTVNSGAAYVVNDIYKRYINPTAPERRLRRHRLDYLQRRDSPWNPVWHCDQEHPFGHRVDRLGAGARLLSLPTCSNGIGGGSTATASSPAWSPALRPPFSRSMSHFPRSSLS